MTGEESEGPGRSDLAGAEVMRGFLPSSPFVTHVGIRLVRIEAGRALLHLPFHEAVVTIGNVVHGGAVASLIDTAAMVAAWSDADVPENLRGTTVSLSVSYMAPAAGEDLEAEARVLRRGRNLAFVDVEVRTASGTVAKGLVTYKLG
jgi:uncharacterized protein (TIGR00369 family)